MAVAVVMAVTVVMAAVMAVTVVVMAVAAVGRVMGVAMKRTFQQKHHEETCQNPEHRGIDLPIKLEEGVRQQME